MKGKLDKRRRQYKDLKKNIELAELIGIILGDGHLHKFSRTERLIITCNSKKRRYIDRINSMITKVFDKSPSILKRKTENTIDISLYQCELSKRLGILPGNKIINNVGIPEWIKEKKKYATSCLKGLFETDGCFQKDPANYAQFIELKNLCKRLREDAYSMMVTLGYNPQISAKYVRLARKEEVYSFINLIKFRKY